LRYGWDKWVSRSHPTDPVDRASRDLRKTVQQLQKQSLEAAARHAAKSNMLPYSELLHIWKQDAVDLNSGRVLSPLKDISKRPQTVAAARPATRLKDFIRFRQPLRAGRPDGADDSWLTARMAARLHAVCMHMAEMAETGEEHVLSSRLPHFARGYLSEAVNPGWRHKLAKCWHSVGLQLRTAKVPQNMCTGHEVACHIAIGVAQEWHKFSYFEATGLDQALPAHPNDSNWEMARENSYDYPAISMLYKLGIANPDLVI